MKPPIPRHEPLVDTHAHLADDRLRGELDGVLARARDAGLRQVLAIGTTAEDSRSVVQIAQRHAGVHAAVGVQPNHVAEAGPGDWEEIVVLSRERKVVAIGETGLDRYWDRAPFGLQQDWFDRHLALAYERDLPVVIHCRDCEGDIIEQLGRLGRPVRGVLHSFTGNAGHAAAFLGLGLHISVAGMITFSNKSLDALRDAVRTIPDDRLLIETDSPYLSPQPVRGRPNQPAHLAWTAEFVAGIRGTSPEALARQTTSNARELFRLPAGETIG
ncbi:putative deoxyribonuclease YcfH [Aquisphaera giovannonii]|uniref:Putative deoxyribonuclease YcfH n=1 Tax=Aquisphaera giovannonii TaxID=406548 RepID=A0A5B9VY15_9BACT|nr:TatD family hydrolase [Aquisphaera giovannonii]QEH33039.1 putative deoxyribonuclease YcfH [Aquisphaera giovannonii]